MASREYDVETEMKFSRDKLSSAIPERLRELRNEIDDRKGNVEEWYANLIAKILVSVARTCQDLLDTIEKEALPAAAWNSRNLLELWVWIKYCSASRENAWRFHGDALRDAAGLIESLAKLHTTASIRNEFETKARQKLSAVALANLGVSSLDSSFLQISDAAKAIGLDAWYGPCNRYLSKFAHPTAGLVIGIMHQEEMVGNLQCGCTTQGLYFAGQCVIALSEVVSAFPSKS
jgi:hypothetical protein